MNMPKFKVGELTGNIGLSQKCRPLVKDGPPDFLKNTDLPLISQDRLISMKNGHHYYRAYEV